MTKRVTSVTAPCLPLGHSRVVAVFGCEETEVLGDLRGSADILMTVTSEENVTNMMTVFILIYHHFNMRIKYRIAF
jgi:hypothetical protein